jgi:hypothetical protein
MATATERRPIAAGLAVAAALTAALLVSASAHAEALRCGSKLITDGDTIEKVLQYCGEPVEKKRTWITRQPRFEYGGREIPFQGSEDVPVDLWTYDFGSSKLMRRIRFVAGKVDSIETLEHGTDR